MRQDKSHLEFHGRQWRVRLKVPKEAQAVLGKSALVVPLHTDSLARANLLKWQVIADLKDKITKALREAAAKAAGGDPLVMEGMEWRAAIAGEEGESSSLYADLAADRAEELEHRHGYERAKAFHDIATGKATPIEALVDAWLVEASYAGRTEAARRQAVRRLLAWCQAAHIPPVVETLTRRVAGRFVSEVFVAKGADPATANKLITGLSAFWGWLIKRGHASENPWSRQALKPRKARNEDGEAAKRPFTDAEVGKILAHVTGLYADLCTFAALSGMRLGEIADFRVRHVRDGVIRIAQGKTDAASRDVPVHSAITGMIASRCAGKEPDAYLFHELPEQRNTARSRGAPVSQAFTRILRRLELDDIIPGRRQARTDFHSFRRWFISKAVKALENGATGFTAWTVADVVGHSNEAGPLGMTMGRYPGPAGIEPRKACVEAVRLP
ncbi:tyrosine-type recombinase/integrase [Xanthobacter sp. DSM 24535]|uniref:tyrosine-type recombinase/integrase n=1 Tax=Roseixanthobacter psychrophilus TaxID=3119917 RepID=UPI003726C864